MSTEKIRGFHRLSLTIRDAISEFGATAETTDRPAELRHTNLAIIFLGRSYFEAAFNETITMYSLLPDSPNIDLWNFVTKEQERLNLKTKWNIVALATQGERWNEAQEPFQSWDEIFALRNELIHYKAKLLQIGEVPISRLKGLAGRLDIEDLRSGHTGSEWVERFLDSTRLAPHIEKQIDIASDEMFPRMIGHRSK